MPEERTNKKNLIKTRMVINYNVTVDSFTMYQFNSEQHFSSGKTDSLS